MRLQQRGFSLVELIVVMAIIGVLAAIAIPAYSQYLLKSTRSAAQSFITGLTSREEQVLLDNRAYLYPTTNALVASQLNVSVPTEVSTYYTVSVTQQTVDATTGALTNSTGTVYVVIATPIAGGRMASDGVLLVSSGGTKCRVLAGACKAWGS